MHVDALIEFLADRRFAQTYGGLADEDALSRPPKGFAADLAGHFRDLLPLMRWLRGAVAGAGQ